MRTFDVSGLLSVAKVMGAWSMPGAADSVIPKSVKEREPKVLNGYIDSLKDIGASASIASLKRISERLLNEGTTWGQIESTCEEFGGRLVDETKDKVFFFLTPRESEFFSNARRGWDRSLERFPECIDDVEEASKCFALSRYPAAVFHSLQVVEAGLIDLGTFLQVTDPHSGWTAVANALQAAVSKKHSERSSFERRNFAFLEQMQALVQGLKNAWRNKISHVNGRLVLMSKEFSPEVAEEILFATRAFMRRLAEELPQRKTKNSRKLGRKL